MRIPAHKPGKHVSTRIELRSPDPTANPYLALAATIADLPSDPAGDAADELAVLVAALEPPDREIFLRKYYLMQSSREIAAALDLRVSTVNTRLSRGRDRLRRQLQERGYTHG